jgi:hypothetical protein
LTIRFRFTGRSENNNEKYGFVDKINTEKEWFCRYFVTFSGTFKPYAPGLICKPHFLSHGFLMFARTHQPRLDCHQISDEFIHFEVDWRGFNGKCVWLSCKRCPWCNQTWQLPSTKTASIPGFENGFGLDWTRVYLRPTEQNASTQIMMCTSLKQLQTFSPTAQKPE